VADEVIAGRYRLEKRLGAGGMAEVWSALDLDLDRTVAVKLLAPHADRQRFEREARAAAALSHPNICVLYSFGETGGRPFMVFEYLPGGSLEDRLAAGRPLPDSDTQRIAAEIAAGLAHAHARGLVHRDLKPSNVLFDAEGRAKIADFGIARLGDAEGLTAAGTVLGTAAYISPEQAAGGDVTPASDVYAFGVILYRMLTGRLPFESKDALEVIALHRDELPPPLATIRPGAPATLESVAMAALSKSPLDRPRDGGALLAELDAGASLPGETEATQVLRPAPSGRTRTAVVLLVAALLAAGGVVLALAVTFGNGTPSAPPNTSPTTTAATTAPIAPPPAPAPSTEATTSEPVTTAAPEPTTVPTTAPLPATVPATTAPATPPPPPPPATTAPPPATTDTTATDTTVTDTGTTTPATPVAPG
jgi:eukaryotic-like serine/threonine-protein kinase